MTKDYIKRQFSNFYNEVIKGNYAKSEDVISKNEEIETQMIKVGVYTTRTSTDMTVTPKADNTIHAQHTDNYSGAFFKVDISPSRRNMVTFNFADIESTDNFAGANIYCKNSNGKFTPLGQTSIIGTSDQKINYMLTPNTIEELGLTEYIEIVLVFKNGISYDLNVYNTIGKDVTINTIIEESTDNINGKSLVGKKVIFLGDSITYLPNNNWTKKFLELTGCVQIANVAMERATLLEYNNTVYDGNPSIDLQYNNVLGNQVQKIINNAYESPDLIIIAIGTNGGITADDTRIKESYILNDSKVALTDVDKTHTEGAFRYCNETLKNLYPNAIICWCNPIQREDKPIYEVLGWCDALKKLTAYGSTFNIETNRCGINSANEIHNTIGECLRDGLHPNDRGAMKMARYNASAISRLFS